MAASLKSSYLFAQHAQIYKQLKNVIKILMQALLVILFTFPQFYGYKKVYHKMKIIHHYIFFSSQRPAAKLHHKFICLAEHLESFPTHFLTQITPHTHHPHGTHVIQNTGNRSRVLRLELSMNLREDFTITEKSPTRAFSWLKVPTSCC